MESVLIKELIAVLIFMFCLMRSNPNFYEYVLENTSELYKALGLDFDCYDTDKRLYIHDPNSANEWENNYDKVLYYTIVGAINHYSKELRTI